ncbi:DUF4349 domain-containing protein [Microbacterium sp. NPDC055903]
MNEQSTDLPELSDQAVARMEHAVFDRIADEPERGAPASPASKRRGRRRRWLTGAGIAAAFAVGVLVTPPILGSVGTATTAGSPVMGASDGGGALPDMGITEAGSEESAVTGDDASASAADPDAGREIVATASAQLEVEDIAEAVEAIGELAAEYGGYVESTSIAKPMAIDDASAPIVQDSGYGWVSVRVPSADLSSVIQELSGSGEVLSSSVSKQDVTSTAIDLRARVDALQASVTRLTELMSQSGSVSELIEAEVALTDRQAELESYQQQLTALEDQIAMSSLQVELVREQAVTSADPAGFGDGLVAGWNGLIVSLNALVVAVGFLLPWAAIAGVILLAIWLIRRRRHRSNPEEP